MKPTEIKDLVVGLLAVIFVAMAIGQFGTLERFARKQMIQALHPKPAPLFFPPGYGGR